MIAEFEVSAVMRDGTRLRANVYRPERQGSWPTLLSRTPYGKDNPRESIWCGVDPMLATRRGFMVVVQDVRGRFASAGAWEPFRHEPFDGHDSVEWAARLPGSNGKVAMYGGSYHGNTQWLAAGQRPPSLVAISPAFTWSEPTDGLLARGGAMELGLGLRWAVENGFENLNRLAVDDKERALRVTALADEWDRLGTDGYWKLPVYDGAALKRHGLTDLGTIANLDDSSVAGLSRVTDLYDKVENPTLHTAGWYDSFLQGTLENHAASAAAGRDSRLIVGPWTHQAFGDPVGQQLFGMQAGRDALRPQPYSGWEDLQLAWFAHHLSEDTNDRLPEAPVRIFVMGANEWRDESEWPPQRAERERWFLRSDRSLTPAGADASDRPSEFAYDPAKPVPTFGGNGVMTPGYASGPVDQAEVERRSDVLVFTSDPLQADLEVTGRVRVVLSAMSSAPSTDWVARLCDVYPDGRSINLCDGILRVTDDAQERAERVIDLWSTCNVFLRGHRLRVQVTSSNFPRWDRNLNTGSQRERRHEVAYQRIHHGTDSPSYVDLPVLR